MKKKRSSDWFSGSKLQVRSSFGCYCFVYTHTAPNLCLYNVFWCATLLCLSLSLFRSLFAMLRLVLHCIMAISLGKQQNYNNQKTNRTFADRGNGSKNNNNNGL